MTDREQKLEAALRDMLAGWRYIRKFHGDLYGVGWDRCEQSADEALKSPAILEEIERLSGGCDVKALIRNAWCWIAHRRFITWIGSGDWLIYRCTACQMSWPEPRLGQTPRGKMHDFLADETPFSPAPGIVDRNDYEG